jgi:hypothetical protein
MTAVDIKPGLCGGSQHSDIFATVDVCVVSIISSSCIGAQLYLESDGNDNPTGKSILTADSGEPLHEASSPP